jgi:hypothetical protein
MGQNEIIQIKADENDCIYLYNIASGTWQKICDIKSTDGLPESVKKKVRQMQESIV